MTQNNEKSTKFIRRLSCLHCRRETTVQSFKQHLNSHIIKEEIKSNCKNCSINIIGPNKFCSKSCAAKYNNARKDYSTFKTGPKKGTPGKLKYLPFTQIKQCEVCGKFHPGSGKSCSKSCKSIILSNSVKLRIDNGWNPQQNRCKSTPSFLEKSFEEWLITKNITNYIKNKTFRCGKKIYFGDFFFPELLLLIELDGNQHKETMTYDNLRDTLILTYFNVKTFRITYEEYIKKSKLEIVEKLLLEQPTGFEPA